MTTSPRSTLLSAAAVALAGLCLALPACHTGDTVGPAATDHQRNEASRLAARGREAQADGKLKEAVELYQQSLQTYGEIPGVRTNLGMAMIDMGDRVNGSDYLKEEVLLNPASAQAALVNLGILYSEINDTVAHDYFSRALALSPNHPVALRGAIECGVRLNVDPNRTLDLIDRALMVETDPKLIEQYKWRKFKIEDVIRNKPKYKAGEENLRTKRRGIPSGGEPKTPVAPPATPEDPPSPLPKNELQ